MLQNTGNIQPDPKINSSEGKPKDMISYQDESWSRSNVNKDQSNDQNVAYNQRFREKKSCKTQLEKQSKTNSEKGADTGKGIVKKTMSQMGEKRENIQWFGRNQSEIYSRDNPSDNDEGRAKQNQANYFNSRKPKYPKIQLPPPLLKIEQDYLSEVSQESFQLPARQPKIKPISSIILRKIFPQNYAHLLKQRQSYANNVQHTKVIEMNETVLPKQVKLIGLYT